MALGLADLCDRLAGMIRRRGDRRVALVVQIHDLPLLARCIGMAETVGLIGRLAAALGAGLPATRPVTSARQGQLCLMLRGRGCRSLGPGLRAQRLCRAALSLPRHAPTPRISAVVVYPPPFGEAPLSDDALFDEGRRLLADTPQVDGQVSLLCAPHSVALSGKGGAERPPAEQRSIPDLSRAVAAFQPQLCCHTGAVTGFEILARLDHPERGLIGPADFLPMLPPARQRQLTRLMLGQGLAALRQWDSAGFDVGTVSLNVSTADLVAHDFADVVLWELDRQDVSAHRLVIEVMEDLSPMDLPERVRSNLDRLAASGCSVDLDDFGTGYAGLDALRRLHVRRVKIDRSFITACDHDHDQQQMILAILALAEHLGLQTLAEGVETAAEHSFVAQIGCTHAQGYAIARPLALAQTIGFLAERRARQEALPMIRRRA